MAEVPGGKLPEFDALRKKVGQRSTAAGQEQGEALKRAFARTGGVGSGAFVKQQQVGLQKRAEQSESALQGIDVAERNERKQNEDTAVERAFRERQQGFAESQADKQFQAGEERFDKQFGLQEQQFAQDKEIKTQQLKQQKEQFEVDQLGQAFNFATQIGGSSEYLATFLQEFQRTGEIPSIEDINVIHRKNIGAG